MAGPHVHRVRVRYSECDLQGVVFNAHYLTYADDALTDMWRDALPGGYAAMVADGVDLVVAEATVRYLAPAHFEDELDLVFSVASLGTTSMTSHVSFARADEELARVTLRHVFVSAGEGTKRPIPDDVREALASYVTP